MHEEIFTIVELAKKQKEFFYKNQIKFTPSIFVEKNNRVAAIINSPTQEANDAFLAATLCRSGFDPDAMTMVIEFEKLNCLSAFRIDRNLERSIVNFVYSTKDSKLSWEEEIIEEDYEGNFGEALERIMVEPPLLDKIQEIKNEVFEEFSEERKNFHIARASVSLLIEKGFLIAETITSEHPEWTNCRYYGNLIIQDMIEDKFLPEEAREPLSNLVNEWMGKPKFKEKLMFLFRQKAYWLPSPILSQMQKFVDDFESFCINPDKFSQFFKI